MAQHDDERSKYNGVSLKKAYLDPNSGLDPKLRLALFLMGAEHMTEGEIREALWPSEIPSGPKERKVVFLDIDGMINTTRSFEIEPKDRCWAEVPIPAAYQSRAVRVPRRADRTGIEQINEICRRTGAEIVVASLWCDPSDPSAPGSAVTRDWLVRHGIREEYFAEPDWHVDYARVRKGSARIKQEAVEIWLADHPGVTFVIIDDEPALLQALKKRVVRSDEHAGLSAKNYRKAIQMLGE